MLFAPAVSAGESLKKMLISNADALKRLNSPSNLINSMKNSSRSKAMSLFIPSAPQESPDITDSSDNKEIKEVEKIIEQPKEEPKQETLVEFNPFSKVHLPSNTTLEPARQKSPSVDDLLNNSDTQIKLGLAHDSALEVLTSSINELKVKLFDIKADKLPQVITATSKVVESIRRERNEAAKNGKDKEVHYHFYTPERKRISDYQVIEVNT